MIHRFVKESLKTIDWSRFITEQVNKGLDESTKIDFSPLEEIGNAPVNSTLLYSGLYKDNDVLENYILVKDLTKDSLKDYPYRRISIFKGLSNPKFTTINLENWNSLSDKVDQKIRNYVFEVVDFFKRNLYNNISGKITFVKLNNTLFVYSIQVKEKSPNEN